MVKGCPLISREKGLQLLYEYEGLLEAGGLPALKPVSQHISSHLTREGARMWLAGCVAQGRLTQQDQLAWLSCVFPGAPSEAIRRAVCSDVGFGDFDVGSVPWNRRKRRSVMRAKPGEVMIHVFSGEQKWKGPGRIVEVEKSKEATSWTKEFSVI